MRHVIVLVLLVVFLAACVDGQTVSVESVEVRTVHVNGVDIGYKSVGQGEPLLMIMGYGGTMDVWDPALVNALAKSYQVVIFDNRNMGYSSTSPEAVTLPLMARDALGLLHALGIEQAHVFGWSMGSIIGQEMAFMQPEVVDKLVLYGSSCERDATMAALKRFEGLTPEQFIAMLFPKAWAEQNPGIYSRLPAPSIPPTQEAISRQHQALASWQGSCDRLASLEEEVLVVVGEDDRILSLDQSLQLVAGIKGAWFVRFRGAGHWLMYQSPEGLADVVDVFLRGNQDLLQ